MKGKLRLLVLMLLAIPALATLLGCAADLAQGVTSAREKAVIDKLVAATLADDRQALAALFTKDAIFDDYLVSPALRTRGPTNIVTHVLDYASLDWQLSGAPFEVQGYIVQPVVMIENGNPIGQGVQVLELNADDQIRHVWLSAAPRVAPITEDSVATLVAGYSSGRLEAYDVQVEAYKSVGNWAAAIVNSEGSDPLMVMFKWGDQGWRVLWEDSAAGIGTPEVEDSWITNGAPFALVEWLRSTYQ